MLRKLSFAKDERESCGECKHFFHTFGRRCVYLGKYPANGWCWNKTKEQFYTANNMVCKDFEYLKSR